MGALSGSDEAPAVSEARPETVSALLAEVAARRPAAPALIEDGVAISFADLEAAVRRTAGALRARGLGPGDRLALWLPTLADYLVLSLAAWHLGATTVSVNTRFQSSELAHILGGTRPRMLAFWPGFPLVEYRRVLGDVPAERLASIERLLVHGTEIPGPDDLPAALRHCPVDRIAALARDGVAVPCGATPESPCVIFTTSGTTKAPKFVLHRQAGVARHGRDVARRLGFDAPDAVTLQALPLCAVFGFAQALGAIAGGAPQHIMPIFDGAAAAALIRRHGVTHCMGTDDMFSRMLAARPEPVPFPTLRVSGFVIFNPAMKGFLAEAQRRGLPLLGVFGMSEVSALFALQRPEDPPERRLSGGGYPVSPEARIRVRDEATGGLLPAGRSGMLEIRGPSMLSEYYGNPEATRAALTEDGFLRTGDIGFWREDGSFAYEARAGDVLRLAGFLVSPTEIEHYLEQHPSLRGVQVVGALLTDRPCAVAFVLLREGATLDETALKAYCATGLAKYKVPERFVALEEFPVTLSGNGTKIQRHKLRAMAQALLE